ncbi:hypothetical protein JM951_06500 [Xanthomonas fragariae]|uniref:hypothetical protein n=1 Tax=Xanthomonas fragariae TaxID=48664 RepID=UPI0003AAF97C|nr:hypothetical protein [Xanthomonas fragariae]MBL9220974.1 hypothetical protein [Xanthomonas fragariae]MDM7571622.1 hypothetical protein [Xanthomonas fragariae]
MTDFMTALLLAPLSTALAPVSVATIGVRHHAHRGDAEATTGAAIWLSSVLGRCR